MKRFCHPYYLILGFCFITLYGHAQNVGINATGAAPAASAGLDIDFTNKGVLVPRVALTATNSASPVASPATSLLVYNTATAGSGATAVTPGYYYWSGSAWVRFSTGGDDWKILGNANTTSGTNFLGTTNTQALDFRTNNTLRFRIANGNQVQAMSNGTAALPFYSWSANTGMGFWRAGTNILATSTAGVERMRVNASGQVLVNTTIPTDPNRFEVKGNDSYWLINSYNTGTLSGSGFFHNTSSGNGYNSIEGISAGNNAGIWGWNTSSGTGVRGSVVNTIVGWAGYFAGDVGATGTYYSSDVRWKKNIQPIEKESNSILNKIKLLEPMQYNWNAEEFPGMGFDSSRTSFGFIAQELEEIFPELVTNKKNIPDPTQKPKIRSEENNVTGYYMVDYIGLIPILTKGIQEQQQIIESQNNRIEKLEQMLLELKEEIKNK
ncbi:MAG: tail fiber domain-containing protein [Brumimicrobium sp.]|nr:tail fiber domain-containing protein [Brumimicrobium sp.]